MRRHGRKNPGEGGGLCESLIRMLECVVEGLERDGCVGICVYESAVDAKRNFEKESLP